MGILPGVIAVALLAMVHLWVAIAVGLALNLHPAVVAAATSIGCASLSAVCIAVGDRTRTWLLARTGLGTGGDWDRLRQRPVYGAWQRYGIIGFAFVGPMVIGAAFSALMGLALGVPASRLLVWLTIGNCAWCTALTFLVAGGAFGLTAL
jgi:hypothetical protein